MQEQQVEVAAALMGMSEDEVRPQVVRAPQPVWPRMIERQGSTPPARVVVVQRKARVGLGGSAPSSLRRPLRGGL